MPSVFRTHFKAVGFPALLALHGEPVVYLFRAGGSRSFNAIVIRQPVEILDAAGNVLMAKFTVRFTDSSTVGVQANVIDTGGDQMEIFANEGDVATTKVTVLVKNSQSNGVIELALA